MKKNNYRRTLFIFLFCVFFMGASYFYVQHFFPVPSQREVTYSYDLDGDSAVFIIEEVETECRFLGIDTPEKDTEMGIEAAAYTKNALRNAKEIVLELDPASDKYDKYGRYLAWVWLDGELLQYKLVEEGYAEIKYIYGNYKYMDKLYSLQNEAKANKKGIWK